jgi:hypothetical protein
VRFLRSIRFPLLWNLIADAPQDHPRVIPVPAHKVTHIALRSGRPSRWFICYRIGTGKGKEGQAIPVMAYSNAEEVELLLNGKSLGNIGL